jgi:putative FmdB family regulatory protein
LPIYEFACRSCDHRFEELVKANGSQVPLSCPDCGSAETARLMSAFAVRSASGKGDDLTSAFANAPSAGAGGCCGGACGCH